MIALRDYRNIWSVATARRESGAIGALRWILLAMAAIGVVLALAHHNGGPEVALRVLLGFGVLWLTISWAFLFLPVSLLLNSAANARLIPRQRRRLMEMAAGGWLLASVAVALVAHDWGFAPLAGLYFLALAFILAGRRSALAVVFVLTNWNWLWSKALPAKLVQAAESGPAHTVLMVAVLAAGAWSLRWLYPAGGDAHVERHAGQARNLLRFTRPGWVTRPEPTNMADPASWRLYALMLRRACRARDPGEMLYQVLGPAAHWTVWLSGAALIIVFGVAARLWLIPIGGRVVDVATSAGTIGPLILLLASTGQVGQLLRKTRGEQALLRLTPLAGDTAALNRRLAVQLLRQTLCVQALLAVAILLATALLGAQPDAILRQLALCCLAAQAAMPGLLGDYAGAERSNLRRWLDALLPAALETAIAFGFGLVLGTSPWPWLALLAVGMGAGQVWLGWVHMLSAPPAFPVGRMEGEERA
jgi:hypothetical protein